MDIQHVGSTSIPEMPAKPILDIAVAVESFEGATLCIRPLEELGYTYRGENGIPRRHYFVKGEPRTHHLHMVEATSAMYKEYILFRDYLVQHPDIALEYALLKKRLAQQFVTERQKYQEQKDPFVQRILQLVQKNASLQ